MDSDADDVRMAGAGTEEVDLGGTVRQLDGLLSLADALKRPNAKLGTRCESLLAACVSALRTVNPEFIDDDESLPLWARVDRANIALSTLMVESMLSDSAVAAAARRNAVLAPVEVRDQYMQTIAGLYEAHIDEMRKERRMEGTDVEVAHLVQVLEVGAEVFAESGLPIADPVAKTE
eukprot:m51a1_g1124 hypothetical protein (177) ;mRNA; r:189689-190324